MIRLYLQSAGQFQGFSRPELFRTSSQILDTELLLRHKRGTSRGYSLKKLTRRTRNSGALRS
jgi:hypothetical protein